MSREQARIEPGPGEAATIDVTADPAWLALAVYGRVRVDSAAFTVDGPADSANRFAAYFGG
jgi:hypothetical protein